MTSAPPSPSPSSSDNPTLSPYNQPIGPPVAIYDALTPTNHPITGTHVQISRLSVADHATDLWETIGKQPHLWTYIPGYGPFTSQATFTSCLTTFATHPTRIHYAITSLSPHPKTIGVFALINSSLPSRAIELGFVVFSPLLQRTTGATEAFYLITRHVFDDCHYRRYVWKCDDLNAPSKAAALRLGFREEGVHRCDLVVKGRNRDTAWFGMLEGEWEGGVKRGFEKWLDKGNMVVEGDGNGVRKKGLRELREEAMVKIQREKEKEKEAK